MILCLVLAHGGVADTCMRHLPVWMDVCDHVLFSTPSDDPIKHRDILQMTYGTSARYAAATNVRTRESLRFALRMSWTQLVFCEYDALLWDWPPGGVDENAITASKFMSADPSFLGSFYLHSPIIFGSRSLVQKIVQGMDDLRDDAEKGFGDRYFGLAAERMSLPIVDGHSRGWSYSQNHITGRYVQEAVEARRRGAILMHGIKEGNVFESIRRAG